MMGASDAHKDRPSLLGSSAPTAATSTAAPGGESTRVLAQFGGRESGARSFFARPGVWASLAVLIGVAGATTYHLQSKRADAAATTVAAATPAPVAAPVAKEPPKPDAPVAAAAPEPTPARIIEGDSTPPPTPQQQQQASTPFAAIGAQPMAVPPAAKPARVAAASPSKKAGADSKASAAVAKKPERIASGSKKPVRTAANGKPVKTAANTSKATKPAARTDLAQTAARPKGPDPDTDLLTALLKRSKTSDPAPSAQATAATADCKPGAPCKP
ncbi:hypothetical protein FFI97_031815 [Variovorax sp. KBS0712]|uniref:hypothetical protein n=1 Tax=Variovorax sp. KBS0712 TaxID=2578111 RepID=UPI0011196CA9|nr:hypothetical protein [Variovorax sp. KBS0712]TSD53336.1 hypothetical protein FFI97_031815 [Variovorax sp. KBS0712]